MAEDQSAEFIDHSILLLRIVAGKILSQLPEEFALAILLAFQTKAYESRDRFAHTCVNSLGVLFHLLREPEGRLTLYLAFDGALRRPPFRTRSPVSALE